MQIPLVSGIRADSTPDLRTALPRNYAPVPKQSGISQSYMKPCDGLTQAGTGPGIGRGGHVWNGQLYRVLGTKLCTVSAGGSAAVLGDIGGSGQVTIDHSFDRLAIASGNSLWYWSPSIGLVQVTDPNVGVAIDVVWLGGYYVTTDGVSIVATNLTSPTTASPLSYGSAEEDPNPVYAVNRLRGELYAFTRYSIQVFQNIGSTQTGSTQQSFPFQVLNSATVPRGILGTHTYCPTSDSFFFLGSAPKEAPSFYIMVPGDSQTVATRELETILQGDTDAQRAGVVCERITTKAHEWVFVHLPDQCLVYDLTGSEVAQDQLWHIRDSGTFDGVSTYRGRNWQWCYDQWNVEDPTSTALGYADSTTSAHWGQSIAWELLTPVIYDEGQDATIHNLELVALPGRVAFGSSPVIWTSYSYDGEIWSLERSINAGGQGDRTRRLAWRRQGRTRNYRIQRFRGTSDAHIPLIRLEADIEPLFTQALDGRPD